MTCTRTCFYSLLGFSLLLLPLSFQSGRFEFAAPAAHADCLDIDADPDFDADGDDVPDCEDECPVDRNKATLGVCGCGIRDDDLDRDGWVDHSNACPAGWDECPTDVDKFYAGACGCGFREVTPYEDGSVECDNPEDEEIEIKINLRGRRATVRLTKFQGNPTYRLAVQKRNSRGRFARMSGSPYSNTTGNFEFRLDPGEYRFVGQVRRDEDRSRSVSAVRQLNRR